MPISSRSTIPFFLSESTKLEIHESQKNISFTFTFTFMSLMSLRQIFVTQAMWDDHEERGGAPLQELPWRQLSAQIARQLCL